MRYTYVRQHDTTDCAAASLAMVCLHYKKEITITRLRDMMGTDMKGTNLVGLQKAANDAPHAERRDEDAKGIPCPLLAQAVFLHDRLLEHAPRSGQACQYLDGRARRQDGPGSCFLHFVHHLRE